MFDFFKVTPQPDYHEREQRQADVFAWAGRTFGDMALDKRERARRFIEEAIELAQACGIGPDDVADILDHVYDKPPGDPFQEAGGVGITLLALCQRIGISADHAERAELARVLAIPADHFRERHNRKVEAGVAVPIS